MKVILLAGGFGTRLAEYTDVIPKTNGARRRQAHPLAHHANLRTFWA